MSNDPATVEADERLLVLVGKLMDKSESTPHPHEAEAFARKAAELVARYRIEPSRLRANGQGAGGSLAIREIAVGRGAYVRGRLAILEIVARYHDVRVVFGATPTGTVAYLAGFTADLDVVAVLYQSLHTQAAAQMAQQRRATPAATQRFRRSFLFGFADRLDAILGDVRRAIESEMGPESGSTALALRERTERVDEFVVQSFGRVRTARPAGPAQMSGFSAGAEAANGVDVGRTRLGGQRQIGTGR
jgi:hypothetical protein